MPTSYDVRHRVVTPGQEDYKLLPVLTSSITTPENDKSTLQLTVSGVVYKNLPEYVEVQVQWFINGYWFEPEGTRFVINVRKVDDKDVQKTMNLTGVNYVLWKANKATLAGVAPRVETWDARGFNEQSGVSANNTTFTKNGHGFVDGEDVMFSQVGKTKNITKGTIYKIYDRTANTFKIKASSGGGVREVGKGTGLVLRRVQYELNTPGGSGFRNNNKVIVENFVGGSDLVKGESYFVTKRDSNSIRLSKSKNGKAVEIKSPENVRIYSDIDGARSFTTSPGGMIAKAFTEAQARGWGEDLYLIGDEFYDADGNEWPEFFKISFDPGRTLAQMLDDLVAMGMLEYGTNNRVLSLYVPGRGTNRAAIVRIGYEASEIPVELNIDNIATHVTSRAEGRIQISETNPDAPTAFGRLEAFEVLSGVTSKATAEKLSRRTRAITGQPDKQYSITIPVMDKTKNKPYEVFFLADTVAVRVNGAWSELRVVEMVMNRDTNGVVTMTAILNSRFSDLLTRLAKRAARETGSKNAKKPGGTVKGQTATNITASVPVTDVSSSTIWTPSGNAAAALTIKWNTVELSEDGEDEVTVANTEAWIREEGQNDAVRVGATEGNVLVYDQAKVNTEYYVTTRAVADDGTYGEFSDEFEIRTDIVQEPMDPPTVPATSTQMGTQTIAWNGLLSDSENLVDVAPPEWFDHVNVMTRTNMIDDFVTVDRMNEANEVVVTVPVGLPLYVQLVAVDNLGVESIPSSVGGGLITTGVNSSDLSDAVSTAIAEGQNAALIAQEAIDQAELAQESADGAYTIAVGKSKIVFSTVAPTSTVGYDTNDMWWVKTGTQITGSYELTGGAWVQRTFNDSVIANLNAGKITSGFIDAARINAGTITTTHLATDSVTAIKIAAGTITGNKLVANTITAGQIAAGTITTLELAANAVKANNIEAGAITTAKLSATAIDGMTVTGAVIRSAATGARWQGDSTGIRGYNSSGTLTFSFLTSTGALSSIGGTITGGLIQTSAGATDKRVVMNGPDGSITAYAVGSGGGAGGGNYATLSSGRLTISDGSAGGPNMTVDIAGINFNGSTGDVALGRNGGTVGIYGGYAGSVSIAEWNVGGDSVGARIWSPTVYNRTSSAAANMVVISAAGTIARSTSSRRYKMDIKPEPYIGADPLSIELVSWKDKAELTEDGIEFGDLIRYHGAIAEQLVEVGMSHRVTYDDQGRPDAIQYDRIALDLIPIIRRLAERVTELESR